MKPRRVELFKDESAKRRAVLTSVVAMGLGMVLLLAGCLTIEQMAPPVSSDLLTIAAQRGVEAPTLEEGRRVYLEDCTGCHTIEPIARYSAEKWHDILPMMARKAKLDLRRRKAVEAYVTTAHLALMRSAEADRRIASSHD